MIESGSRSRCATAIQRRYGGTGFGGGLLHKYEDAPQEVLWSIFIDEVSIGYELGARTTIGTPGKYAASSERLRRNAAVP